MQTRLLLSKSYFLSFEILMGEIIKNNDNNCKGKDISVLNMNRLAQPVLFCFYQGLELLLKGFVLFKYNVKTKHNCEKLYNCFKNLLPKEKEIIEIFQKYIINFDIPFLREYKDNNKFTDMEKFYNSLRYPDRFYEDNNQSSNEIDYSSIQIPARKTNSDFFYELITRNKIKGNLDYYQEMIDDGNALYNKCSILFRKLEDNLK